MMMRAHVQALWFSFSSYVSLFLLLLVCFIVDSPPVLRGCVPHASHHPSLARSTSSEFWLSLVGWRWLQVPSAVADVGGHSAAGALHAGDAARTGTHAQVPRYVGRAREGGGQGAGSQSM